MTPAEAALMEHQISHEVDALELEFNNILRAGLARSYVMGFSMPSLWLGEPVSDVTIRRYLVDWMRAYPKASPYMTQYASDLKAVFWREIERGVTEGLHPYDVTRALKKELAETGMERYKLERIARTELMRAYNYATLDRYGKSGIRTKSWCTYAGCCDACAELHDTEVALNAAFSGGYMCPPLHPNCRCVIAPGRDVYDNIFSQLNQIYNQTMDYARQRMAIA